MTARSLLQLIRWDFLKLELGVEKPPEVSRRLNQILGSRDESSDWRESVDLTDPYQAIDVLSGHEADLTVLLGRALFFAQDVLGFSLREALSRTENSLVCSPIFRRSSVVKAFDVFVIMPFDETSTLTYKRAIAPAAKSSGLSCGRGDDFIGANHVMNDIWTAICDCKRVIADCSRVNRSINGNVFYELGIAHTVGKDVLLIGQDRPIEVPFDIRHLRYIHYENSEVGMETLKVRIQEFLEGRLH